MPEVIDGQIPEQPVHPNCRCVMVPVLEGMEDDYRAPNFLEWLDRQPPNIQIDVLELSKYAKNAYKRFLDL